MFTFILPWEWIKEANSMFWALMLRNLFLVHVNQNEESLARNNKSILSYETWDSELKLVFFIQTTGFNYTGYKTKTKQNHIQ